MNPIDTTRSGLRDRGGLEAAAARPHMTFGGDDLYADLAAKAAALMHSIVMNHPFVDRSKRVGAMAAELLLIVNGHRLDAPDEALVDWPSRWREAKSPRRRSRSGFGKEAGRSDSRD